MGSSEEIAQPTPGRGPSRMKTLSTSLEVFLDRWQPPEQIVLLVSATLIGSGTGLGAVFFIWLMGKINVVVEQVEFSLSQTIGLILSLAIAGLAVGYMVDRWAKEAKGHGVPEVMEAMVLQGGRIRPVVAVVKVLASSLTIGAGGSAGREGPIVQVGSALGSTLGQLLRFSDERIRTLVACGAAAGIAATFNAPIAGAIFALEIILGRFTVGYFGAVVISSVSAGVVSRMFLGNKPAFTVPSYPMNHISEMMIYIVLGILASFVAVAFIRGLYWTEGLFDRWAIPASIKASLGLVLTGLAALALPGRQVLGPGLDVIGEAIAKDITFSFGLMAALLVLKLLATCFTLGSGNSGGVFAPSLFMGAILGGIVGTFSHNLWPGIAVDPGAYAIVGAAAVFAASARAPITAVLIVFEMSNDYRLILPLMVATVIATVLAENLFSESIYTFKLKLRGIKLDQGRDVDVLEGVLVREVMTPDVETIHPQATIVELSDQFSRTHSHGFPIVDENDTLWGIVTVSDLDRAIQDNLPRTTTVDKIGTPRERMLFAYPDETMGSVLSRMSTRGIGRLPVVSREDPTKLIGLIWRAGITRAYQLALTRRSELQHRTKRMQMRHADGTEFMRLFISDSDWAAGKTLQEIRASLPQECILVSIQRGNSVLIPHGDTELLAGDQITAFVRSEDVEALRKGFSSPESMTQELQVSTPQTD